MDNIKIVVDSGSMVDRIPNDYNFEVLRHSVIINDKEYLDGLDLITEKDFYNAKQDYKATTSQPNFDQVYSKIKRIIDTRKYTDIIIVAGSSKMSGAYNVYNLVKNEVEDEINVHVIDTLMYASPVFYIAEEVVKLKNENKTALEIVEEIDKIKLEYKQYTAMNKLDNIVSGGRFKGEVDEKTPILKFKDGSYVPHSVNDNMEKSLVELANIINSKDYRKILNLTINHVADEETAIKLKNLINVELRSKILPTNAMLCVHLNKGTIHLAFREKD
jgi:DegV family protein with EDD domain